MKASVHRLLTLLMALALVTTACGDDGADGSNDEQGTAPAESSEDRDEGSGARLLVNGDCREYYEAFEDAGTTSSPEDIATFGDLADFMEEVADRVPSDISDDFEVLARAYRAVADGMGGFDFTDPSAMAAMTPEQAQRMQASMSRLDEAEFQAAADNISKFFEEECG